VARDSLLPEFIEHLYFKRFGKERPDVVISIEERSRVQRAKKSARKEAKQCTQAADGGDRPPGGVP